MKVKQLTLFDTPWLGGNEVLLAKLSEIGIPKRIVTSMKAHGVELVGAFVQLKAVEILSKPGVGRGSFQEAKEALQGFGLSLGMELRGWDEDEAVVARHALGRRLYKRIYELKPTAWQPQDTLEDELVALLLECEDERNAEMLRVFYGFNEQGPQTLEYAGEPYHLTRERVRQIAARTEQRLVTIWRPLKRLEQAKELLRSRMGPLFTQDDFSKAAQEAGITRVLFHLDGVLTALDLVGERHSLTKARIGGETLYGSADRVALLRRLLRALRKETSANGCTNIQRLSLVVGLDLDDANLVRDLLAKSPEVYWLDTNSTWLLSKRSTRNRLVNVATRVFTVSKLVEINELRNALRRPVRVSIVPPPGALGNLLQHYGIATVIDRNAVAEADLEPLDLGVNDQGLVYAFEAVGSPATREQLEDYCIDELGMNATSFYIHLSYSPLVEKLATGVFSLVGRDVDPGTIDQLKQEVRAKRQADTSGWSKVGTLWWHFQAERPTVTGGTRAVPTFVFNLTSGEWRLRTIDGLDLGIARIENGFASGFRAALAALGVAAKDFLQVDFDLAKGEAFVRIVGDDPEELTGEVESDEFDDALLPDDEDA